MVVGVGRASEPSPAPHVDAGNLAEEVGDRLRAAPCDVVAIEDQAAAGRPRPLSRKIGEHRHPLAAQHIGREKTGGGVLPSVLWPKTAST